MVMSCNIYTVVYVIFIIVNKKTPFWTAGAIRRIFNGQRGCHGR